MLDSGASVLRRRLGLWGPAHERASPKRRDCAALACKGWQRGNILALGETLSPGRREHDFDQEHPSSAGPAVANSGPVLVSRRDGYGLVFGRGGDPRQA